MHENKTMRNRELMRDYRRELREAFENSTYETREKLINGMLAKSRPRFDVSYEYAVRMMNTMIRDGKPCPMRRPRKQAMWNEIREHVERIVNRRKCPIYKAVAIVLAEQTASRYYLSYNQASKILYHENRNRRSHSAN